MQQNPELLELGRQLIKENPNDLIIKTNFNGNDLWLKRRPHSKKNHWHRLQYLLAQILVMPVFRPTVSSGGRQSLGDEAQRLSRFAAQSVPVPSVLALDELFLMTSDVGIQLHQHLRELSSQEERNVVLMEAIKALSQLHRSGFCHGRPSFGDMTVKEGRIYFIDLEEDPLTVMTLAQAQARDLWLFLNNAARYSDDQTLLVALFQWYRQTIAEETLAELTSLVKRLKPVRKLAQFALKPLMGRDLKSAVKANQALEGALSI